MVTKILLVDDNRAFLDSFQSKYENENRHIDTYENWEEAFPFISEHFFDVDFIVLDGKGHNKKNETNDGDETFAINAREDIERLININKTDLPYCFYTAYSEDKILNNLKSKNYSSSTESIQIFKKEIGLEEENRMFNFIERRIREGLISNLKINYPDIFEIFKLGYLDNDYQRDFVNTLKLISNLTDDNTKQFIRNIRPLLEAAIFKITELNSKFISPSIRPGNEQSLQKFIRFLAGEPKWNNVKRVYEYSSEKYLPLHVYESISGIQKAISICAMHNYAFPVTKYAAIGYMNGLLDFMIWLKSIFKTNS
jgi:CheY-like chemotaxis protein